MAKHKPVVTIKKYRTKGRFHHDFETFEDLREFLKHDFTPQELDDLEKNLRDDIVKYMTDTGYGITAEIYYFKED